MSEETKEAHYDGPAGGWGSLKGIAEVFGEEWSTPETIETLGRQNKTKGFMCTSCAWPKPPNYHPFEFCENGAKATIWELTSARAKPTFFDEHTVGELRDWSDHDLEKSGRLTHPMRYDEATDKYVEVAWDEAFAEIGQVLKPLDPKSVVFYSSGHAGLEPSYLWGLLARLYGNNNLPQSSNMCHETTSVGLKMVIGSPVGTVNWPDLDATDAYFFFGQNPGSNSPRFLHPLQEAKKRGAKIVTFNPLREQGLVSFVNPQDPVAMLTGHETQISDLYLQVRSGGDIAAIMGLCKVVLEADDEAQRQEKARIIDTAFIQQHTHGYDDFIVNVRLTRWEDIERESGLSQADLRAAGEIYIKAEKVIGVYGMGLTQQAHGHLNVAMVVNLLLLRGNIGKLGAGCCPVRGHSNVQGQRTVGIAEKTALVPMDKLKELFGFDPPKDDGMNIVAATTALFEGKVKAFLCMGGNLLRAVPDQKRMEDAWPKQDLTVVVSTKLNRSHLYPGKVSYILPCIGRTDKDEQATGPQWTTTEDSFSNISASMGKAKPPSEFCKSELAIIAGIAKATLPANPKVKWDEWTGDYSLVRDLIEKTFPKDFRDFNGRMFSPGGFYRGNAAHERVWNTEAKKAMFTTPHILHANGFDDAPGRYRLITMRSNDQFNTTIYGYEDRFRGIKGTRAVVLMNAEDIAEAGFAAGDIIRLTTDVDDGHTRELGGLTLTPYNIPRGTIGGYYPECNVLVPIDHHDALSKTPASKSVPVRIQRDDVAVAAE